MWKYALVIFSMILVSGCTNSNLISSRLCHEKLIEQSATWLNYSEQRFDEGFEAGSATCTAELEESNTETLPSYSDSSAENFPTIINATHYISNFTVSFTNCTQMPYYFAVGNQMNVFYDDCSQVQFNMILGERGDMN